MKKIISIFLLVAMMLCVFAGCNNKKDSGNGEKVYVMISVKDFGDITLELYPDIAPITVENFVKLANEKFYDGLIFHRIISGFMIQGGDPEGTGMGGSGTEIKGEFSANGVKNDLSHTRGVISMARGSHSMDSASSQFFICHADAPHLNGQYAAFGKVIEGLDVVDAIASVKIGSNDRPVNPPVIETIKVIDKAESTGIVNNITTPVVTTAAQTETDAPELTVPENVDRSDAVTAVISVENFGDITLELYPKVAPVTVDNFVKLANEGFYEGIIFHRIIPGFMIQGGDPEGTGFGGSAETIKGEFASNGVENKLSHKRGVISMARNSISMDSASSQFFICHKDAIGLDGDYAAFGIVVDGMDVVDAIAGVQIGANDRPVTPPVIKSVTIVEDEGNETEAETEAATAA